MKKKRILSILIGLIQILYLMPISVFAQVNFENRESKLVMDESTNGAVELGLSYLKTAQKEDGIWKENKKLADVDIVDMLEYIESEEYENESLIEISEKSTDCFTLKIY